MRLLKLLSPALLIAGLLALTVACGSSSKTQARFVQASPDAGNLDVALNSKTTFTNVAFGQNTGYQSVPAGSQKLEVRTAGTTNDLISSTIDLGSGFTTILSTGYLSSIAAVVLPDTNTAPSTGNVSLRVINASPTAGSIDVYIVAPGTSITGVTPTVAALAFRSASSYLSMAAGTYELIITPAGNTSTSYIDTTLSPAALQIRSLVVLDAVNGGFPITLQTLADLN